MNSPKSQALLQQFILELKIRNYSPSTIKSYSQCLNDYFNNISNPLQFNIILFKNFLLQKLENNISPSFINIYINAIKFFYTQVLNKNFNFNIKSAKRPQKLPIVLTKNEIAQILNKTSNTKHKLILALAYGAGMRVSEISNLKINDINIHEKSIHIKNAKGKKDRITLLPEKIIKPISIILQIHTSNKYLFTNSQNQKLTTRTLQKIFQNSRKKANIKKPATFHSLRHSFATHLLENGVDIRYIQALLGHNNIRTTQQYTQVTNTYIKNIKSPL